MRYREIVETDTADQARRDADRRRRGQQRLDAARRKKADAARQYQDKLRTANNAQQAAQASMRSA